MALKWRKNGDGFTAGAGLSTYRIQKRYQAPGYRLTLGGKSNSFNIGGDSPDVETLKKRAEQDHEESRRMF